MDILEQFGDEMFDQLDLLLSLPIEGASVLINGQSISMKEIIKEIKKLKEYSDQMKKNKPDEQIEETDSSEIQKLTKEELQKYTRFKQYKKDKKSDSFLSQLQKKYSRDTHRAQYAFVLSDKSLPKYLLDLSKSTYMMILLKQENKIIIDDIIPVIHRPHSSRIVFTSRPYYKLSEELSQEYGVEQMNKLIHFHWKFDVRLSQCDVVLKDFGFDL